MLNEEHLDFLKEHRERIYDEFLDFDRHPNLYRKFMDNKKHLEKAGYSQDEIYKIFYENNIEVNETLKDEFEELVKEMYEDYKDEINSIEVR